MRDGVVLRADVMRPAEAGKFPVLVYRTPYGKDAAQQEYTTFKHAARAWLCGRNSGRSRPVSIRMESSVRTKTRDETATTRSNGPPAQTWSNGAVGTFGLSYPGAVQWLAAFRALLT